MDASPAKIHLFQISAADLGCLWIDLLHLSWNQLSPIEQNLNEYMPGAGRAAAELLELAKSKPVVHAAAIVARPDLRLHCWTGGGATQMGFLSLCRNQSLDPNGVAVVSPSHKNSLMVHYFPTVSACANWVAEILGAKVEDEPPALFPPSLPFESALYALHAIDCFRRVAYQSMLDHKTLETPHLSVAQFASTFQQSLGSADLRWLLPAFLHMAPGAREIPFQPQAAHLAAVVDARLLRPVRVGNSPGEAAYAFGEAGRLLGIEFLRTWLTAAGLQLDLLSNDAVTTTQRVFLAPTAVANHWFSIQKDTRPEAPGQPGAGYAEVLSTPLTLKELSEHLVDLVSWPVPLEESAARPRFCMSCGKPIQPSARFCNYCGQAVV
ncbi:MAG TPA: zinc ribbon domain-containing protein [Anaerolineaceae bacterium]|nr:zinc ribbon domain-containing protein [Anaerolineaceae bacterium]